MSSTNAFLTPFGDSIFSGSVRRHYIRYVPVDVRSVGVLNGHDGNNKIFAKACVANRRISVK